jgi:glycosyltransferase involved in cell wall biosynthesis
MPAQVRQRAVSFAERKSLDFTLRFYELARLHFSPNRELVELLLTRTGKPGYLMERGVDTWLFSPGRRERTDRTLVVGYVGRLSPEKNVRFLASIEAALIAAGYRDYRFLVVGEGSERDWLRANLRRAELPGILQGEPLAKAYASMDIFVFPSSTDTFGNVVLEATASGVPAVVTADGGPKFLVRSGVTGFVAANEAAFIRSILELAGDPELVARMRRAAREYACGRSWDAVFESVYEHYEACWQPAGVLVA